MEDQRDEILTVEQLGQRLQLKPSFIYRHADELGAYRAGKYLRFRWSRVLRRLEEKADGVAVGPEPEASIGMDFHTRQIGRSR